jgi:hypothetical protein
MGMYRVEVSGWDSDRDFFVEKTDLHWDEDSGKRILIGHELSRNALVFVRLLQPVSPERTSPVAYSAEFSRVSPDGRNDYRLTQLGPRQ